MIDEAISGLKKPEAVNLLKELLEDMIELEKLAMDSRAKNHYYKRACFLRDAIEKIENHLQKK